MENEIKSKIETSIKNLKEKQSKLFFLIQDTKNNAKASVRYIYQMAFVLKNNGFNPIILHEKKDYSGVSKWLDEKYMTIPHQSIEEEKLEVSPDDFIIVPEIFGYIMPQVKSLPCGKIVIAQSYLYMLDTLQPGESWSQFGFLKCITTSNKLKEYIERIMKHTSFDILSPYISDSFTQRQLPPMPIIGVHTKNQYDAINIIKTFYLKYPQYRWFTFRDLRGLSELEFSKSLSECFVSVWIDDDGSFGTFPLESMSCGVPVIGKIPNLPPEWMTDNNGMWITDKTLFPDVIADFAQNWLEDNINPELYSEMENTKNKYINESEFEKTVVELFNGYLSTRLNSFEQQISKIEE